MFSIEVVEVLEICGRKGITLIGRTSGGRIMIGDYLYDNNNKPKKYKVIALESVRYSDLEKSLTHNPAVVIESDLNDSKELKGRVLIT